MRNCLLTCQENLELLLKYCIASDTNQKVQWNFQAYLVTISCWFWSWYSSSEIWHNIKQSTFCQAGIWLLEVDSFTKYRLASLSFKPPVMLQEDKMRTWQFVVGFWSQISLYLLKEDVCIGFSGLPHTAQKYITHYTPVRSHLIYKVVTLIPQKLMSRFYWSFARIRLFKRKMWHHFQKNHQSMGNIILLERKNLPFGEYTELTDNSYFFLF